MRETSSLRDLLQALSPKEQYELVASLTEEEATFLLYDWELWARDTQLEPQDPNWVTWLIMTGRGWGKTRVGAETVTKYVRANLVEHVGVAGATAGDTRDIQVEGESGLLAVSPPWFKCEYVATRRLLRWPNGAIGHLYSGEEPERARGPQHGIVWEDELPAWQYAEETHDNLMFGLRRPPSKNIITTTPRPVKLIRDLRKDPNVFVTTGSTYENKHLTKAFFDRVVTRYEGTRLGAQELHGAILEDTPGALWSYSLIAANRVSRLPEILHRVAIGVDPAVTSNPKSNETGIISAAVSPEGIGYVFADNSLRDIPEKWGKAAVMAFTKHDADVIVAETNNGGDLVTDNIKACAPPNITIPIEAVRASRGKLARAEPISALTEQGLIKFVGELPELEEQLCRFVAGEKPETGDQNDRADAFVWVMTYLSKWITRGRHMKFDSLIPASVAETSQGRGHFNGIYTVRRDGRIEARSF